MPDLPDVTESPSTPSALESAIASSPEALEQQSQESQSPTAEQGVTQEPEQQPEEGKIPYSRFKEKVDEANWLKQQLEQQLQRQQSQQQFQQPESQPQELGNTPEEREFWRTQRRIAKEVAEQVNREAMGQIRPVIDAGRQELAMMKVQQFRAQHSDVKANSPEEVAIAEKISMGYLPEDAYRSVMWDKRGIEATTQAKQQVKNQIDAKKKANTVDSSASIPAQAQSVPKKSFKDKFLENLDKAENGTL